VVVLTVGMMLAVAGCGGSGTTAATSTSARAIAVSAGASTSSPAETAKAAAATAYLAMWSDYVDASATNDYQSPLLADHATGNALAILVHGIYGDKLNGVVTKGAPTNTIVSETAYLASTPPQVKIVACGDDSTWLTYSVSSGKLDELTPAGRHHIEALVVDQGGMWKVAQLAVRQAGTC
jgi:hypothetical protein